MKILHFTDNQVFALSPNPALLGVKYELIDEDAELARYYWMEALNGGLISLTDVSNQSADMLWQNKKSALLKQTGQSPQIKAPAGFSLRRLQPVPFIKPAAESLTRFPEASQAPLTLIQDVLDSVNVDSLYATERHLSGEEAFWLNGQWDSIQTRNSYSPQIGIAQHYLTDRLLKMGFTVELQPFLLSTFQDVDFAPGQSAAGWLISENRIYGTGNGGQNWILQHTSSQTANFWSVFALDASTAYAVGDAGVILKTVNGTSWQLQQSGTGTFLFGVYFINQNTGWISGDNGLILKTVDGGQSWQTKSTPVTDRLYDIFFVNDSSGWAVGRNGRIIHSADGGETWSVQNTPNNSRLYGVHFLTETTGFAVGWDGTLLKTDNGGANWNNISSGGNNYLYDIDFIDSQNGIVTGWGGTCLRSSDGGNSWNAAGNILAQDIYGCDFADSQQVWAAGYQSLARSNDRGNSWENATSAIAEGLLNNIIATKTGTLYPDQHYIICAHYDATSGNPLVRAPGADDNGSGTSGVIEAARVLAPYNFNYSLKFILFPGEEQGLHGSSAYASQAVVTGEQILGVINMDMIGYDGNSDGIMEIHAGNMAASQTIGTLVNQNVTSWNLPLVPQYKTSGSSTASDHSSFWNAGYPAIMIIEDFQDFTPWYHTVNDLLSSLDADYFRNIARLSIGSIAALGEISAPSTIGESPVSIPAGFILHEPYPNPFNPVVHIEFELATSMQISADIYDVSGRRTATLAKGNYSAGRHQLEWNGRTEQGSAAATGIYLCRITAGKRQLIRKLLLVR
ncbi:MAG: M28 family peptidase [Calditrichia bacterium]